MLKYYALTQKASGKAIYLFHTRTYTGTHACTHARTSSSLGEVPTLMTNLFGGIISFFIRTLWQMKGTSILHSRLSQGQRVGRC